jgi:formate--tetrahydrofolate ligase
MVALTSRMQHEFNYTDEQLAKKGLKRLNIDPRSQFQNIGSTVAKALWSLQMQ